MDLQSETARAADLIIAGGVVAIPTDTLYGLAADALNSTAVERVYDAKGRPADMPLPVLVSSWRQAMMVTTVPAGLQSLCRKLADHFWPGSLTLVLPVAMALPERLTAGRDTIAVRMPDHPVPLAIAETLGRPITGTSANRSGEPDITDPGELHRLLADRVDGIITAGPDPLGTASTIVAVSEDGLALLREGALPFEKVLQSAGAALP